MAEHLDHNKAPQLTNLVFALLDHGLKEYATVFLFFLTEMDSSLTLGHLKRRDYVLWSFAGTISRPHEQAEVKQRYTTGQHCHLMPYISPRDGRKSWV